LPQKGEVSSNQSRGDEPICFRGSLCELPLRKRVAQLFSHTMKPVKNEKKFHQQKQTTKKVQVCWSRLNALRATQNSFAGRMRPASLMFVTPELEGKEAI